MEQIFSAFGIGQEIEIINRERYNSCFAVSSFAAVAMGSVGGALAALIKDMGLASTKPSVQIDQRLASLWFGWSIYPVDWEMPPAWNAISGDYQAKNGWIKLHANLPHHRAAALLVLKVPEQREQVERAIKHWDKDALETQIVEAGGVAAALRSYEDWQNHPQGQAVAAQPLVSWGEARSIKLRNWQATRSRPLNGLRVLDLTRVLAGPVATRTLAGFGAQVLRIDPPGWDEANVIPEISLGKRCSFLDLKNSKDKQVFEGLLSSADVLVHGYRPGALAGLGYNAKTRARIAPNLIDICLNAYGWEGAWSGRRGFDSLVQMSCGIAHAGMEWASKEIPTPLPVQALDHATGYFAAAAVLRALSIAVKANKTHNARLSLARTAKALMENPQTKVGRLGTTPAQTDFAQEVEHTPWGQARRLKPAIQVSAAPMKWERAACKLGSAPARWVS